VAGPIRSRPHLLRKPTIARTIDELDAMHSAAEAGCRERKRRSGPKLKDLLQLKDEIKAAIVVRQQSEKADLKAKMAQLASDAGLSLDEVLGIKKGRGGKSLSTAKYRNPDDPTDTWTGRGRKPNWLVERLKKRGATMDDFLIS